MKQIRTTLQQKKGSWKALFSKIIQPTLIVGAGLAIFQQVTGINTNTILYYAPSII
ncbi:MFS transporter [Coxiella-like endosymbiont of Rhipicephalus sanguineus]|uniref:MFS transporter n=1 Tax=Coxiella-like endosymbiont of Rhipicephalus sanguineus TaxID=1955402 RepID=UPI0020421796|nr:MFS transporter [Coxiella-like endosymbiont of Rhipicephalus sanguineus]